MAFPTVVDSTTSQGETPIHALGFLGPILSGGAVYLVLVDNINTLETIQVYKATDPSDSFTEQDAGNAPDSDNNAHGVSCVQEGTDIHIAWVQPTSDNAKIYYAKYDMSSDVWVDVDTDSAFRHLVYTPTAKTATNHAPAIAVRSDGDIIIVHQSEAATDMGQKVDTIAYSRLEGGSWTVNINVFGVGTTKGTRRRMGGLIMGGSDQAHIAAHREEDNDHLTRALSSSNVLRTERSHAGTFEEQSGKRGVKFTRSGTTSIGFDIRDGATEEILYRIYYTDFSDDTNPTFIEETMTTDALETAPEVKSSGGLVVDSDDANQKNYLGYMTTGDADIFLRSDGGGTTWGDENSGVDIREGVSNIEQMSANIFDWDGNRVYGFVYNDGGSETKYDQFTLYALATFAPPPYSSLDHQTHMLVR